MLGQAFNTMTTSLRQSDQAKTAFISDVSHELRTPLTVIKGTIETLEDGAMDDLTARGPFLASMSRETERLIRLVNDLLVLTRADAGALNLQLHPIDLGELARTRCEHLARAASQRQVHLQVVTSSSPYGPPAYVVMADADRLAQVLDNLLDNAIRYAPPGSEVTREPHPGGRSGGLRSYRYRPRHPRPTPTADLRALLPGRPGTRARPGRQRSGPGDCAQSGAGPWRARHRQQCRGSGDNDDFLAAQSSPT